jgi:hypothetical protein
MIDWTLLKLSLWGAVDKQLPLVVAITIPQAVVTGDVFSCELNGRAVLGAGEEYQTSNNQTLENIAAILADESEVADAEAVDFDSDDILDTIILTRRRGFGLTITEAFFYPEASPHEPIEAEVLDAITLAIWSNQNQPAPPEELWLSMLIYDLARLGHDQIGEPDEQGEAAVYGYRSFKLSVAAFGPGAYMAITALADSLEFPSMVDYFAGVGLSCIEAAPVKDTSEMSGKDIQEGASLELEFNMAVPYTREVVTDQVGVIETVDFEVNLTP